MRILFCLTILFLFNSGFCQESQYYRAKGNLIRVPFTAETINYSDTVGTIRSENTEFSSVSVSYSSAFNWKEESYFIRTIHESYLLFEGGGTSWVLDRPSDDSHINLSGWYGWCGTHMHYEYLPISVHEVNDVLMIQTGASGNILIKPDGRILSSYRANPDELCFDPTFYAYLGLMDGNPLVVTQAHFMDYGNYQRVDLTGFPDTLISQVNVIVDKFVYPESILQILPDVFLIKEIDNMYSSNGILTGVRKYYDNIEFITNLKNIDIPNRYLTKSFFYKNGQLLRVLPNKISVYNFNPADTTFSSTDDLVSLPTDIGLFTDLSGKFAAWIASDTLRLFNIDEKKIEQSWYVGGITVAGDLLVTESEVYIPQETSRQILVSVEPEEKKSLFLISAYPNPFNPETTIRVTTSKSETGTLKVFDLSGRLVWQSEKQQFHPGATEVKIQPDKWASGMYLLRVEAGNHVQSMKLIFAK